MTEGDTTDRIFKALSASTRRALLDLLKDAPKTTGELCAAFPELDRCTVMLHLSVLEEADLVIVQRQGRERWNYLNPLPIRHIHDRWIGPYAAQAVTLLDRLATDLHTGSNPSLERGCEPEPGRPSPQKSVIKRQKRGRAYPKV